MIRKTTQKVLDDYKLQDIYGELIKWTPGQIEIIDCILHRASSDNKKRIQVIAATRWGKSLAVAAGVVIRASLRPERWAIVAGTKEKARIIMEYITSFSLDCTPIKTQLEIETPLERLRMRKSQDRLNYKSKGEVRVYSAEARRISETSTSLMGFGAPNVIEDESALVPDTLQATVMRMLGDKPDNFLCKIGNPFNRGHFLKSWQSGRYYKILIDYLQGIREGRFSKEYIEEMKGEALFDILYECKFPEEGTIDEAGWLPLLTDVEIERAFVENEVPFGFKRLGCDVAGGGRNFSVMVLRAYNLAKKVYKKNEPDTMLFAGNIIHFANNLKVKDEDIAIDKIGIGKGAFDRVKAGKNKVAGVSGSDTPVDTLKYANLRAEVYWRTREWILKGGKLEKDDDWYQLSKIRYKVDSRGRIKIMSKEEMLRQQIDSPDVADALSLTFARMEPLAEHERITETAAPNFDPYPQLP